MASGKYMSNVGVIEETKEETIVLYFQEPNEGIVVMHNIKHRRKLIDLFLKSYFYDERPLIMPWVFSEAPNGLSPMEMKRNVKEKVMCKSMQIFGIEFLIQKDKFTLALREMSNHEKRLLSFGTRDFMMCIYSNRLVMKHIFRNQTELFQLSKAMIHFTLKMAGLYKKEINPVMMEGAQVYWQCVVSLVVCIQYWKSQHFMFAVDIGLSKLMADMYQECKYQSEQHYSNKKCSNATCAKAINTFVLLHDIYIYHAQKCEQYLLSCAKEENGKLMPYLEQSFVHTGAGLAEISAWRSSWVPKYSATKKDRFYLGDRIHRECGLLSCRKRKGHDNFAKQSICKGCRLVRYCCRNHQKRHWKHIHSQQCPAFWSK